MQRPRRGGRGRGGRRRRPADDGDMARAMAASMGQAPPTFRGTAAGKGGGPPTRRRSADERRESPPPRVDVVSHAGCKC